jgi:hypothetical protein
VSIVVRREVGQLVELIQTALTTFGMDATAESESRLQSMRVQHVGSCNTQRAFQPMTGILPSAAAEDVNHVDSRDQSILVTVSSAAPSPWFSAMHKHSLYLKALPVPHIELPGLATSARVMIPAVKAPHPLPEVTPVAVVPSNAEELDEVIPLLSHAEDEAPTHLDVQQVPKTVVLPKEAVSLIEELGTGRSNRRKRTRAGLGASSPHEGET